jgi:hypothetical protein
MKVSRGQHKFYFRGGRHGKTEQFQPFPVRIARGLLDTLKPNNQLIPDAQLARLRPVTDGNQLPNQPPAFLSSIFFSFA